MGNIIEHFEMTKVTEEGEIYIQAWHPDDNVQAVICLVHGLGEHSGRYSDLACFLSKKNYALIALDLPGHGKSFGIRGHVSSFHLLMNMITLLLEEANQRFPKIPCFLYGHSMGGNLVLNYVLRYNPVLKGVIISAPWLKLSSKPPFIKAVLGKLMNCFLPQFSQSNGIDPRLLSHNEEVVEKYKQDPLVHDQISARLYIEAAQGGKWALENSSDLTIPTLLMIGTEDKIVSLEAVYQFADQRSEKCELKKWDGFYHEIHNELDNKQVYTFLIEWLETYL